MVLKIGKDWGFGDAVGVDVSKNATHPCIMHGRRAELQSAERRVESTPPTQLDSRALSSHTFNNESPCRPINNLCLSVASQPAKPSRPAGRVVIFWMCPCIATRCVLAHIMQCVYRTLALWYTAVIIINIYGADDEHASAINRPSAPANLKFAKRRARACRRPLKSKFGSRKAPMEQRCSVFLWFSDFLIEAEHERGSTFVISFLQKWIEKFKLWKYFTIEKKGHMFPC